MGYQKLCECVRSFQYISYVLNALEIYTKKYLKLLDHKTQHLFIQAGVNAYPESIVHDVIGASKLAADTICPIFEIRLAREVTGKQETSTYFVLIQIFQQLDPLDAR